VCVFRIIYFVVYNNKDNNKFNTFIDSTRGNFNTCVDRSVAQSHNRNRVMQHIQYSFLIYNPTRFIRHNRATTNAVCSVHMAELLCRPLKCDVWYRTAKGRLSRFRRSSPHGSRTSRYGIWPVTIVSFYAGHRQKPSVLRDVLCTSFLFP